MLSHSYAMLRMAHAAMLLRPAYARVQRAPWALVLATLAAAALRLAAAFKVVAAAMHTLV